MCVLGCAIGGVRGCASGGSVRVNVKVCRWGV